MFCQIRNKLNNLKNGVDLLSCSRKYPDYLETSSVYNISQDGVNDLLRDFDLSKAKAEILSSRLQQLNLLQKGVKM